MATAIGNALEWYEILIYGYFSIQIARAFFPIGNEPVAILLTLGTFSLSFISRPLGALVLGDYADRVGRTASLRLSIALMTLATAVLTFLPTYEEIGILAPLCVVLARLVQGFSAGGEFGSSTALLIETSSDKRRGLAGSWQFASQGFSTLLAAAVGLLLTSALSGQQLQDWGWRAAFAVGLLIGPIGLYLRWYGVEPERPQPSARSQPPWRLVIANEKRTVLLAIGCLAVSTAVNYMLVYLPTYAAKELGASQALGFTCVLSAAIVQIVVTPLAGWASDTLGRRSIMLLAATVLVCSLYPAFLLISGSGQTLTFIVMAVVWLAFWKAVYIAPYSALIAEQFPSHYRATSLALAYNLGVPVFGGSAPVIMAWLTELSANKLAPSFYLTAVALLSLGSVLLVRETKR